MAALQCEHILRCLHHQRAVGEKCALECKEWEASLWNILLSNRSVHQGAEDLILINMESNWKFCPLRVYSLMQVIQL